jgi:hypothetical protein
VKGVWTVPPAFGNTRCHKNGTVISRWKVELIVEVRIVGVIEDKEPASLIGSKNLKCFRNTLDRASNVFCNSDEVTLSGRRLIDVDPKYSPKAISVS